MKPSTAEIAEMVRRHQKNWLKSYLTMISSLPVLAICAPSFGSPAKYWIWISCPVLALLIGGLNLLGHFASRKWLEEYEQQHES